MEEFNIGNIEVRIVFNKEKLLEDIKSIAEKEEIQEFHLNDKGIHVYGEDDFYTFDLMNYIDVSS